MWPFKPSLAKTLAASLVSESERWEETDGEWRRNDGVSVRIRTGYASVYGAITLGADHFALRNGDAWRLLNAICKVEARRNREAGARIGSHLQKEQA